MCADRGPLAADSSHLSRDLGLTGKQRETLLPALERGYFDGPRATTQSALAESLGVSDSAVSEILRRAITRLVAATLASEDEGVAGRDGTAPSVTDRT